MNKLFILSIAVLVMILLVPSVWAHGEPQKKIGGYRVTMTILESGDITHTRFFFDEIGGSRVDYPITFNISIKDDNSGEIIFKSPKLATEKGIRDFSYSFPTDGFYEIIMEFEANGQIHMPEDWLIWIEGQESGSRKFPIDESAIAGYITAIVALSILIFNLIRKFRKK